jgi:outer membrane protein TolC
MTIAHPFPRFLSILGMVAALLLPVSCTTGTAWTDRMLDVPPLPAQDNVQEPPAAEVRTEPITERSASAEALSITLSEAILLCLENNAALVVERLNPPLQQTFEDQERAIFDPEINAEISVGREKGERLARSGSNTEAFTNDMIEGVISLQQYFPTGTRVAIEAHTQIEDASLYSETFYSSRLGMTVTQALLRGYGTQVNRVQLQQARLDSRMSEYELRGFTASLVAELEQTYWDYALAQRQIEIVEASLAVARQQQDETEELINIGRLARAELSAVQAEVAAEEQALIEARAKKDTMRLQLLRLLNPKGAGLWARDVELIHQATLPVIKTESVELHAAVSKRMRPILNEARLQVLRGDLELVKTRNGILPLLDFFLTLGKSGYASSFGESIDNISEDNFDAMAGVRFQYPLKNRDADARHQRALLSREQNQKVLANLTQIVEVDVRRAHIEVNRTQQQIAATSVTRKFDEEKFRTETEKLRVGKSTSFLVAQAQRDLLSSRIREVQALTNYLKALINLYLLDGSLLERRGIAAPGREPVEL